MKKADLEHFRAKLEAERTNLASQIVEHRGDSEIANERGGIDQMEVASFRTDSMAREALTGSEENLLKKINFALERIRDGSYGSCAECGGEIPRERLEAKPSASLCVGCQSEKEAGGSRRG